MAGDVKAAKTKPTKRTATWKAGAWKIKTITDEDKLDMIKAIEKTKKPIHPKAMPISAAKRKRESKLLMELQKNHGYTMLDTIKPVDRFLWSFNFKTGAGTLTRMLRLSVPRESALGRAMAQSDKAKDAKARAEAKAKARKHKAKTETRKAKAMAKVDKLAAKVASFLPRKVAP